MHAFFEDQASSWQERYESDPGLSRRIGRFASALERHEVLDGKVLDLGCGVGAVARALAAEGYEVTGSDISAQMLERAANGPGGDRVKWLQQEAQQPFPIPLGDGGFAAVIASSVLEYLRDPSFGLIEMRRLLRPGGWALFTVPDPSDPARVRERLAQGVLAIPPVRQLAQRSPVRDFVVYLDLSINRYPVETWHSLVRACGLTPSELNSPNDPLAMVEAQKTSGVRTSFAPIASGPALGG